MAPTETSSILRKEKEVGLLPIKFHFILLYGAGGGVIPYLPILGKQLGLTATAVGLTYTAQPIAILISKPLFGVITDHVKSLKLTMMILALVQAISYSLILLLSPIERPTVNSGFTLGCFNNSPGVIVSKQYNQTCIFQAMNNLTCDFRFDRCVDSNATSFCNKECDESSYIKGMVFPLRSDRERYITAMSEYLKVPTTNDLVSRSINYFANPLSLEGRYFLLGNITSDSGPYEFELTSDSSNISSPCDCGNSVWKTLSCEPKLDTCLLDEYNEERLIYNTFQFWAFTVLVVLAGSSAGSLFTLSDAACYEILGNRPELYGKQRMWATASWGIVTLFTGYLNGVASNDKSYVDYGPGFYIMLVMLFLDMILLFNMPLSKSKFSSTICKDVGKMFASAEIVTFTIGVFISGGLCGLLWNYQFWYLQNLGANQLLLGLTVAIQCVAEVPFFLISGYMINKLGHFTCLALTFLANCLRYILYCLLTNPWYVLPIEIIHGQTYANFYVTMTSFASLKAPPGTEATMLGVLGGVFEGLGVACGTFLSGIGFDFIGGRSTFLYAGIFSGACAVAYLVVRCVFRSRPENVEPQTELEKSTEGIRPE